MPADLITAIVDLLATDPAVLAAVPGKVWAGDVPAGEVLPYGRLTEVSEVAAAMSPDVGGAVAVADVGELQISIFATSRGAAYDGGRAVETALNDATAVLTFDDGRLICLRRKDRRTLVERADGPAGGDIWHRFLTFDCVVQRTL